MGTLTGCEVLESSAKNDVLAWFVEEMFMRQGSRAKRRRSDTTLSSRFAHLVAALAGQVMHISANDAVRQVRSFSCDTGKNAPARKEARIASVYLR